MRDRFEDFQKLIQVQDDDDSTESNALLPSPTEDVHKHSGLDQETEYFLSKADLLQQRMLCCQKLLEEMKLRQSEVLTQTNHNDSLEEDLDCILKRIKDSTSAIHTEIKVLQEHCDNDDASHPVERRIKRCQVSVLQRVFRELMYDYNSSQLKHREDCKKRITRQLEITGDNKSEEEVEVMLEKGDLNVFASQLLAQNEEARDSLKLVETRHGDIIRLEKSLYELQDLFLEIASTVKQQGELIDNIEHNVLEAEEALHAAVPVLKKAHRYQKRACCPCLYLCDIL